MLQNRVTLDVPGEITLNETSPDIDELGIALVVRIL
jgi:hypothetical protein